MEIGGSGFVVRKGEGLIKLEVIGVKVLLEEGVEGVFDSRDFVFERGVVRGGDAFGHAELEVEEFVDITESEGEGGDVVEETGIGEDGIEFI
jgi:hypothetical protein